VRIGGRRLDPVTAAARAKGVGLATDKIGIVLPLDGSQPIERLEDRLMNFLDGLYRHDPERFLTMPKRRIEIPADGTLPRSAALLERFYGDDFCPARRSRRSSTCGAARDRICARWTTRRCRSSTPPARSRPTRPV